MFPVAAKGPEPSVIPLRLNLPLQTGVDEATAVAPRCFSAQPRRRDMGWCKLEENILPVMVFGALCYFFFRFSSFEWL
jgi:hypothetical protein